MLARLHHYEELEDHQAFFKRAFGAGWTAELFGRGVLNTRGEIAAILAKRTAFTRVILPRLRALRFNVEEMCPGHSLAKPPSPQAIACTNLRSA